MASYPGAPVVFPARSDGQTIYSAHVNALQDEIAALEAALLSSGLAHDLKANQSLTLPGVIAPAALTGVQQNDYSPAGLATAFVLRQAVTTTTIVTGLAAQPAGRVLCIFVTGGGSLTLPHLSVASAVANRVFGPNQVDQTIPTGCGVILYYDSVTTCWRVLADGLGAVGAGATEGTWVPTLIGSTGGSCTLSSAAGQWTKIGRRVTVDCLIVVSAVGSPTGIMSVGGLPFTAANTMQSVGIVTYSTLATSVAALHAILPINDVRMQIYKGPAAGAASATAVVPGDIAVGTVFRVTMAYMSTT